MPRPVHLHANFRPGALPYRNLLPCFASFTKCRRRVASTRPGVRIGHYCTSRTGIWLAIVTSMAVRSLEFGVE